MRPCKLSLSFFPRSEEYYQRDTNCFSIHYFVDGNFRWTPQEDAVEEQKDRLGERPWKWRNTVSMWTRWNPERLRWLWTLPEHLREFHLKSSGHGLVPAKKSSGTHWLFRALKASTLHGHPPRSSIGSHHKEDDGGLTVHMRKEQTKFERASW